MGVTVRRAVVFVVGLWCLLIAVQWVEFAWSRKDLSEVLEFEVSMHEKRTVRELVRDGLTERGWHPMPETFRVRRKPLKIEIEVTAYRDVRWGGVLLRRHIAPLSGWRWTY